MNLNLEERIRIARNRLMLIQAASNFDTDHALMDGDELMGAVSEAAREALDALEPINAAPFRILNWSNEAPDQIAEHKGKGKLGGAR